MMWVQDDFGQFRFKTGEFTPIGFAPMGGHPQGKKTRCRIKAINNKGRYIVERLEIGGKYNGEEWWTDAHLFENENAAPPEGLAPEVRQEVLTLEKPCAGLCCTSGTLCSQRNRVARQTRSLPQR
jgi:hypothetical protein